MRSVSTSHKRCPKCNALVKKFVSVCPECQLLSQTRDTPAPVEYHGPAHPVVRFFWGLGIPLDFWLVLAMLIIWLPVLTVVKSLTHALFLTTIGIGFPFLLIIASSELCTIPFLRVSLEEIDPIAIKIFAWVYLIGFQTWLVYWLANA